MRGKNLLNVQIVTRRALYLQNANASWLICIRDCRENLPTEKPTCALCRPKFTLKEENHSHLSSTSGGVGSMPLYSRGLRGGGASSSRN